jgi:hypothetical protein
MNRLNPSDFDAGSMMKIEIKEVWLEIRLTDTPGPVKAYADLVIQATEGMLRVLGYAVIRNDSGTPAIGFPCTPGDMAGEFLSVVDAEGDIQKELFDYLIPLYETVLELEQGKNDSHA